MSKGQLLERELREADLEAETKKTVAEELEECRLRQQELRDQVDRLRDRVDAAKKWTAFDEDHFRSALSCSLELLSAKRFDSPLPAATGDGPPRYEFPALDQRVGADVTWAETMDWLRAPRRRDQKPWEWRKESPLRPVVFKAPDLLDDTVVHLHLEHPLARRLLSRFTAQGFVHDDLSRACLTQTEDAIPRVILVGRLCVYSPGAARLHEELIYVAARWREPSRRNGKLQPYAAEAERRSVELLEQALLAKKGRPVGKTVAAQLLEAAPRDVAELLPHLERRGAELAKEAEALLAERGRREAKEMAAILEAQKKRVAATVAQHSADQLRLDFEPEERRQLEANRRHWDKRLGEIDRELKTEPQRIRELCQIKASRMEPVGLAYLWPVTG